MAEEPLAKVRKSEKESTSLPSTSTSNDDSVQEGSSREKISELELQRRDRHIKKEEERKKMQYVSLV